ncbi:hypothetical protein [Streptomyces sp. NPDC059278]|uniref:hypothetical protein n=1 Tax=Streptomyces sp. NPDC059278 TaxID=3346801 RepID=UPI00367B3398
MSIRITALADPAPPTGSHRPAWLASDAGGSHLSYRLISWDGTVPRRSRASRNSPSRATERATGSTTAPESFPSTGDTASERG